MGFKYLIRMRNNHYKKEKLEMESNDEIIDLKVRTNSVFYAETEEERKELKKLKQVKTRIIKTIIPSGEEEHLTTNISKEELGKKADEFNNEIKKYLVPIKPGRTYPRKKMRSMNKYRHNLRKNC